MSGIGMVILYSLSSGLIIDDFPCKFPFYLVFLLLIMKKGISMMSMSNKAMRARGSMSSTAPEELAFEMSPPTEGFEAEVALRTSLMMQTFILRPKL